MLGGGALGSNSRLRIPRYMIEEVITCTDVLRISSYFLIGKRGKRLQGVKSSLDLFGLVLSLFKLM